MLKKVQDAITDYHMILPGEKVVAGVSGGADSVVLLLQLIEYKKKVDFSLLVFHLNHLIREEASQDEEFVRKLCDQYMIPFFSKSVDVQRIAIRDHISTEEAGRMVRYEAMRELKPDKIAVGHHSNDLSETVILNMCRGTGLHGMVGIAPVQGDIIRPLIFMNRTEIESYLAEICQPFCVDITNAAPDYTRNRIRHNIIPALKKDVNDRASEHIAALAQDMFELERYIDSKVAEAFDIYVEQAYNRQLILDIRACEELDVVIFRELILKILEKLTPKRKDIARTHIDLITDICDASGEKSVDLPYGLRVIKTYDELIFEEKKDEDPDKADYRLSIPNLTPGEGWSSILPDGRTVVARVMGFAGKTIPNKTYTKWFDYDKIDCSKLQIRYRQSGDYLTINSDMSKKTLQDYMVDEKIEKRLRDHTFVLAEEHHVLWVIGHRISEYYKLDDTSSWILEIEIISE